MSKFVCKNCGSDNIEIKAWINPNTDEWSGIYIIDEIEPEDTWCSDCETHGGIEVKE